MLIGITGPQGSGKSSFADYLSEITKIPVMHCDELVHDILTLELFNRMLSIMGLPKEDKVDRKKLGRLLFEEKNRSVLEKYNNIIYSILSDKIKNMIAENKSIIIDWNFLPITDLFELCDIRVLVTAPENIRIKRVMARDNITFEYAMSREKRGLSYDDNEYDLTVYNCTKNISLKEMAEEVAKKLWK